MKARPKNQSRGIAAAPARAGGPPKADGWQTPEEAGITCPEAGEQVLCHGREIGGLRFSESDGFYLFDKSRSCALNGKPVTETDVWRLLIDLIEAEGGGEIKLHLTYEPRRRMVNRLTRAEAALWCVDQCVPECLRNDVIAKGEGRQP